MSFLDKAKPIQQTGGEKPTLSFASKIKPVEVEKPKEGFFKTLGKAFISSEKGFAETLAMAGSAGEGASSNILRKTGDIFTGGQVSKTREAIKSAESSQQGLDEMNVKLGEAIVSGKKQNKDTSRMEKLWQENTGRVFNLSEITGGTIDKTAKQIAGEGLGVGLDIITAGSLAKGTSSFKLFSAAEKAKIAQESLKGLSLSQAIARNIEGTYKATLGNKLLNVGKKAVPSIAKGAGIGYGYDVSIGLQSGEDLKDAIKPGIGTAIGAMIPGGFAAKEAANLVKKGSAPMVINSLIKPLLKDFSYGKNPGRAVAEEGIVANTLDGLESAIGQSRAKTGQAIGELSSKLQGKVKLSLKTAFGSIDKAMEEAAKNNNSILLQRLQKVKQAVTNNLKLGVDELGNSTIIDGGAKNLEDLEYSEAFKMKKDIGNLTQWTGNVSDDKAVNKALKGVYGNIKSTMNDAANSVSPEIAQKLRTLNEKYADLTSAEIATKYREKINARQNILSFGNKFATATGLMTGILTGQTGIETALLGVSGAVLDKILGSTAAKTRIAKWLAGTSPSTLEKVFNANPKVRQAIYNAFNTDISEDTKSMAIKAGKWFQSHTGLSIEDVSEKPSLFSSLKNSIGLTIEDISKKQEVIPEQSLINKANKETPVKPYKETGDLTTKILKQLEGRTTVSKQFISDLTNKGELKQTERDIIRQVLETEKGKDVDVTQFADKVKSELLPLKAKIVGARNENTVLPDNLRGNVANYFDRPYESPIATSIQQKVPHNYKDVKNYFGHTRIEDMADNKTRRVIEVQSDLYQKGNLEKETLKGDFFQSSEKLQNEVLKKEQQLLDYKRAYNSKEYASEIEQLRTELPKLREKATKEGKNIVDKRNSEVAKLQQYNDPTAHFRMIREEIKKASQDGKTKLQFPTGETAMKIEGLGQENAWFRPNPNKSANENWLKIKPEELKTGNEISNSNYDNWIITDVLGDGKFKAVPKQVSTSAMGMEAEGAKGVSGMVDFDKFSKAQQKQIAENLSETFDISGKVDTSNPIYKFYEKDVQKYLNKFGGKKIIDNKGVSWIEVPITKEHGTLPVEAFGFINIGSMIGTAGAMGLGALSPLLSKKENKEGPRIENLPKKEIQPGLVVDNGIKDAIFAAESSSGKDDRNRNYDAGKYGWMVGFTKGTYEDIKKMAENGDDRYIELLSKMDFDSQEGAINSAIEYMLFRNKNFDKQGKFLGTHKYDNWPDIYENLYNASSEVDRKMAKENFKKKFNQ